MKYLLIFFSSIFSLSLFASNHLTVYFIRSPLGINWSSPRALAQSTLKNQLAVMAGRKHSIGHIYAEYNCEKFNLHKYFGMTSSGTTQEREMVLKKHYGLGASIADFDGHLEQTDEIISDLNKLYKIGQVSFFKIKISDQACLRMNEYMNIWQQEEIWKIYGGLHARPLYKEGSGCSAFGASFLEISGLLFDEFIDSWTRQIYIPYKLIGGPRTGKEVKLTKLLVTKTKWANNSQDGFYVDFFDPDKMYSWANNLYKKIGQNQYDAPYFVSTLRRGKSKGVYFDLSHIATPEGPIFKK